MFLVISKVATVHAAKMMQMFIVLYKSNSNNAITHMDQAWGQIHEYLYLAVFKYYF